MKALLYILFMGMSFSLSSCKQSGKEHISRLVEEWGNKEIKFPSCSVFTIQGRDTIDFDYANSEYKVVTYVDSTGCTSCKLQLPRWKQFMEEVDTTAIHCVSFLFYFYPKDEKELGYILRRDAFSHPVCVDKADQFNALNNFPSDMTFHTFLLDRKNRVVAMGNPVLNPKVKGLYLRVLTGEKQTNSSETMTEVSMDKLKLDFGTFPSTECQEGTFSITNMGEFPLVIQDVVTSCGCVAVEYDKAPVPKGKTLRLQVRYEAEHPEYFSKTITVYCNSLRSPFRLNVCGNAK